MGVVNYYLLPIAIQTICLTEENMKYLFVVISFISLAGCGTIGGAMLGAGEDLGRAGSYIKGVGNKL